MSKTSIARKGDRFMSAHNSRVLRKTKALTKAQRAASAARLEAAFEHGLLSPQYEAAYAAFLVADRAMWVAREKAGYVTLNDRVLIAVFGQ